MPGAARRCSCSTAIPQTHVMWHLTAPALAKEYTVICADLRGYGDSSKPETTADHKPHSKRAMARDMIEVMASFGFDRFPVVGHDRGGRVAYRMALDRTPGRTAALEGLLRAQKAAGHEGLAARTAAQLARYQPK